MSDLANPLLAQLFDPTANAIISTTFDPRICTGHDLYRIIRLIELYSELQLALSNSLSSLYNLVADNPGGERHGGRKDAQVNGDNKVKETMQIHKDQSQRVVPRPGRAPKPSKRR
jgi:hypothetical protein